MPSKNERKIYAENTYYHVYNRGVNKNDIFLDDNDYAVFLNIFKRYLHRDKQKDSRGRYYSNYYESIELNAYCLMPNHYHLLIFNINKDALAALMMKTMLNYSKYFNTKYKRVGPLFQGRYKASMIDDEGYFSHISRYIHLNPRDIGVDHKSYSYSSFNYYVSKGSPSWLKIDRVLSEFRNVDDYARFVSDYVAARGFLADNHLDTF